MNTHFALFSLLIKFRYLYIIVGFCFYGIGGRGRSLPYSSTELVTMDASFEKKKSSSSILKGIVFGIVKVNRFHQFEEVQEQQ